MRLWKTILYKTACHMNAKKKKKINKKFFVWKYFKEIDLITK